MSEFEFGCFRPHESSKLEDFESPHFASLSVALAHYRGFDDHYIFIEEHWKYYLIIVNTIFNIYILHAAPGMPTSL